MTNCGSPSVATAGRAPALATFEQLASLESGDDYFQDEVFMSDLPDLDTIATMLTAVEARDPNATTTSRFDEDHNVLRSTQAEIVEMLARELPAEYDKDALRALLDRIDNDIDRNRALRGEARSREGAGTE